MEPTFLLYSLHDDGHETLEHESPTFDLAQKEADGYLYRTRIYAKVFLTENGERERQETYEERREARLRQGQHPL